MCVETIGKIRRRRLVQGESISAIARECFALLTAAQDRNTPIRWIRVAGSKSAGTKYSPRLDLVGKVTMAIPEPGNGIEIVFRKG